MGNINRALFSLKEDFRAFRRALVTYPPKNSDPFLLLVIWTFITHSSQLTLVRVVIRFKPLFNSLGEAIWLINFQSLVPIGLLHYSGGSLGTNWIGNPFPPFKLHSWQTIRIGLKLKGRFG